MAGKFGKNKGKSGVYYNGSLWPQVHNEILEIVEFQGNSRFSVKFEDSPVFTTTAKSIRDGTVRNRNIKLVCGVGFIGYGKYVAKFEGNDTEAYVVWRGIIRRCYDPKYRFSSKYLHKGVYVEENWHNFQNFANWFYSCLSKMPKEYKTKFDVDKDLKLGCCYSEDNCILLPYKLNNFIQNRAFSKGMGYRKNVKNPYDKITTTVSLLGKQVYIGLHENQEDSDKSYNIAKNYVNRKMATEYLTTGLISDNTAEFIMETNNEYTLEDEEILFKRRPTLKDRIDGLFVKKNNLLERCKYKVNSEIY